VIASSHPRNVLFLSVDDTMYRGRLRSTECFLFIQCDHVKGKRRILPGLLAYPEEINCRSCGRRQNPCRTSKREPELSVPQHLSGSCWAISRRDVFSANTPEAIGETEAAFDVENLTWLSRCRVRRSNWSVSATSCTESRYADGEGCSKL